MLATIKKGMIIKCLSCGKPIKLNDDTMTFDFDAEYIICPHCECKKDIQEYHVYGTVPNDDKDFYIRFVSAYLGITIDEAKHFIAIEDWDRIRFFDMPFYKGSQSSNELAKEFRKLQQKSGLNEDDFIKMVCEKMKGDVKC